MRNIKEKVASGVLNLTTIPTYKLIQLINETDCEADRNALLHEVTYR